tara:strand:- start:1226 stop:3424 length:2199 start_codon:yes stop_codon:yes gene_type:complete
MYKKIIKIFLIFIIIIIIFVFYLSVFGIKTNKFNELIKSQISQMDDRVTLDLSEVFIKLNMKERSLSLNSKNINLFILKESQKIKNVDLLIGFDSIFKKENKLKKIIINSQENEIKNLLKFIRTYKINIPALYLENSIKKGKIIYDLLIYINEDQSKRIEITGKIKNTELNILKKKIFKDINFDFNYRAKNLQITDLRLKYRNIDFTSKDIQANIKKNLITIKADIENKINLDLLSEIFPHNLKEYFNEKIVFSSSSNFEITFNDKFKIRDYDLKSEIIFNDTNLNLKEINLKKYIKNFDKKIFLDEGKMNLIINKKNKTQLKFKSTYMLDKKDNPKILEIDYAKENDLEKFEIKTDLNSSKIELEQLNFYKNKNKDLFLDLIITKNKNIYEINSLKLFNDNDLFKLKNIKFDKNFKIQDFSLFEAKYYNKENFFNSILISKNKNTIDLIAKNFDLGLNIEKNLKSTNKESFLKLFENLNAIINFDIKLAKIDEEHDLKNLVGRSKIQNNKVIKANLSAKFDEINTFTYNRDQIDGKIVTVIYSDIAKPFVKKFNFIKGFEGGKLDFTSTEINQNISKSELRIYNFKLHDMPALTKLLSLASLQGIADLATGEGIRFNEFDMFFENSKNLIKINEIYALGPAISILMEGYVEKKKLVSLRGSLVPATTINKTIAKIPLLGSILVGDKAGEGVFGVSFKIKGPPKNLDTTVNPIKTLTPRFITRTLEKIKKSK